MNRSTLLSACVAVSLLACQERTSGPAAGGSPAPAAPPQAAAPAPAAVDASAPASATGTAGAPDTGALSPDAGAPGTDAAAPDAGASSPGAGALTGQATTADAGSARCSASTLSPEPRTVRPSLPPAVASMRRRIVAAAVACDYAALAALSREKGEDFSFSFGGDDDPAAYWRELEQRGEPVLAQMVKVLDLPYARDDGRFVWPSVHVTGMKSEADWKALKGLYPEKELRDMRELNMGYLGLRLAITAEGAWQYAVAGD